MYSHASLNRCYRIVWNSCKCVWQAVCEIGKAHGKEKSARSLRCIAASVGLLVGGGALAAPAPNELPTGGVVVAGSATVSTSGARMDVLQTTQKAAIDWNTFNIGSQAHVHFEQPSGGVALNRVLDTNASQIYGRLTSTGQVFLVNPNGVFFAPGAQVDVGGIVASTLGISNADFMAGKTTFQGASSNAIINQGNIKVGAGGTAALIAAKITNTGSIEAPQGNVLLGAGSKVSLDMGGPVKLQIENDALETLIQNGGAIKADGGVVWLTSQAANNLASSVINNTGVIEAQTLATGEKGEVILFAHGGHMQVGGKIKADGGFVETSGKTFSFAEGTDIQAGEWLIDPVDITIDNALATAIGTALNTGNVTITTDGGNTPDTASGQSGSNGDISVFSSITKASGSKTKLTLAAERNILIDSGVTIGGSNGSPLDIVLASRFKGGTYGGIAMKGSLKSYGGDITLGGGDVNASDYAVAYNGSTIYGSNWSGVYIWGSLDATGNGSGTADNTMPTATSGGNITIRGKGNLNTTPQSNWGIQFDTSSTISLVTGGSGNISLVGYGGTSAARFWDVASVGINMEAANTYIKAKDGNLTLKGYAGTGHDKYGVLVQTGFVGTNGYINIEGDSFLLRNGTVNLYVGGSGDIKAPIIGINGATYGISKQGSGVLNLSGDAKNWHDNKPTNTTDTGTNGTFTDAAGSVNLVNLTRTTALYAFATVPSTNLVTQSAATPAGAPSTNTESSSTTTGTTSSSVPKDSAVSTAQSMVLQPVANNSSISMVPSPTVLPPTVVFSEQVSLPVLDVSGGLVFVQVGGKAGQGGTASAGGEGSTGGFGAAGTSGRDPFGFMPVFVVNGGVNLPAFVLGQFNQRERNQ